MNAASQFLRVLAILGAIAAGVLFYLTNGKIAALQHQVSTANSALTDAKTQSDKDLKDATDKLTAALADEDQAKKDAASAKLDEANVNTMKDEAVSALNDAQSAAKDKDAQISTLSDKVATLSKQVASVTDLQNQVSSVTGELNDLQKKYDDLAAKNTPPATTSANDTTAGFAVVTPPPQLSAPFPAKILAIDTKNWIVVLDVGSDNGIQKDTQLYLKVGGQDLGAIVVRDAQAKLSTSSVISTDSISPADFAKIVTAGLQVDCQKAL